MTNPRISKFMNAASEMLGLTVDQRLQLERLVRQVFFGLLKEQFDFKQLDKVTLIQLYDVRRFTVNEIAAMFGVTVEDIRKLLRKYGVYRNISKGWYPNQPEEYSDEFYIREYLYHDKTATEIAKQLDCGISSVTRQLHKRGITKRDVPVSSVFALERKESGDVDEES